jgi:hypothetical protein
MGGWVDGWTGVDVEVLTTKIPHKRKIECDELCG